MALLSALRAAAVVFGASLALALAVSAAAVWLLAELAGGGEAPWAAIGVLAAVVAYALPIRRWLRGWGATAVERRLPLPGDLPETDPAKATTRAVTIEASYEQVWPWLAQIGQDRGGFYSYAWLENLGGFRIRNADRINPKWMRRQAGEMLPLHPRFAVEISLFEPGRAIALKGWGSFVVQPLPGGRSRVLARGRRTHNRLDAAFYYLLLELPHFVMERKMLLGIKARAEAAAEPATSASASASSTSPSPSPSQSRRPLGLVREAGR